MIRKLSYLLENTTLPQNFDGYVMDDRTSPITYCVWGVIAKELGYVFIPHLNPSTPEIIDWIEVKTGVNMRQQVYIAPESGQLQIVGLRLNDFRHWNFKQFADAFRRVGL